MTLRPYQTRAVASVLEHWSSGTMRVVLVMPTGAGKTRTASAIAAQCSGRGVWLAHRRELVTQAVAALQAAGLDAAPYGAGYQTDDWARVKVASIDTLVSRGHAPDAEWLVFDECHHAAADTYRDVLTSYPDATRVLGLTATPQRSDGRALGGMFGALVVGAQYSELLADGHIVPCRVFRPPEPLGADLAREPLDSWQRWGGGRPTFAFARDVAAAEKYATEFRSAGIRARVVSDRCSRAERDDALAAFRAGDVQVLWNVHVLTEGVDVPQASCVLLARGSGHAAVYLQMCGRALRPAPGKSDAVLIDLPGASWVHGLPTSDREYALEGRAIRVTGEPLKNCPECGATCPAAARECESCGFEFPRVERKLPKIWDLELAEAIEALGGDPADLPVEHKRREWDRLVTLMHARGWSLAFVRREYATLFAEEPSPAWIAELGDGVQARELAKLEAVAAARGYKAGWVAYRYKAMFGRWPRRMTG